MQCLVRQLQFHFMVSVELEEVIPCPESSLLKFFCSLTPWKNSLEVKN